MPPLGAALASAGHGSFSERLAAMPLVLWIVWAGVAAITIALMILMMVMQSRSQKKKG